MANIGDERFDLDCGFVRDGQQDLLLTRMAGHAPHRTEQLGAARDGLQRLAELMGGTLHARSVPGKGSSFILTLPAVTGPHSLQIDDGNLDTPIAEYHQRIVHYVEDNETNVEVIRGILAQRPQVIMDVSVTGLDGLAAIRAQRPDVILLDMHLPDISGIELLRHLKSDPITVSIPVVVSADALAPQIEEARAAGSNHYLTKPLSAAEFLEVLDEVLREAETRFG